MLKVKFDISLMKLITFFEAITRSRAKDCVETDEKVLFIVEPGQLGKALGKKAVNLGRLETKLKKKVKIAEFNEDRVQFLKNLVWPVEVQEVMIEEDVITLIGKDTKAKGLLIGKNGKNLRYYEDVLKRYFPIQEIKVA